MLTLTPEFQTALDNFVKASQEIINTHWKTMGYTHSPAPTLVVSTSGSRFVAIFRNEYNHDGVKTSGSIHAFVDVTGGLHMKIMNKPGDILKPASYKAAAKHARGSIFSTDFGASCMNEHGPVYLR